MWNVVRLVYVYPFFGLGCTICKKGTPWLEWSRGYLEYHFLPFRARETQMYEKGPCGVFFFVSFSNSLNMKNVPSYPFVGLVKTLNDNWFVTMTNVSFSLLGLIRLNRSDSSEGFVGTHRKWWGGILKSISRVGNSLFNMRLLALCWVGTFSFKSLTFLGLGCSFFPSIWSLLCHHDHRSYGSKSCQTSSCVADMFKSFPSAITLTSDYLYHPKSFFILSSRVDDVGFIMALLRHDRFPSTSAHYPRTWLRYSLLLP